MGPRSSDTTTSSFPAASSASSTPLDMTPFTTPLRNISLVSSGRSSIGLMRSRSSMRSSSRRSTITLSRSARSSSTTATPDSISFTNSAPPLAKKRRGRPAVMSAAMIPTSSSASTPANSATSTASTCPRSAAMTGARDSNTAWEVFASATTVGDTARSTWLITAAGTNERNPAKGSRFAAGRLAGAGTRAGGPGGGDLGPTSPRCPQGVPPCLSTVAPLHTSAPALAPAPAPALVPAPASLLPLPPTACVVDSILAASATACLTFLLNPSMTWASR
mmetsp:Transcript_25032/g.62576  ORF Transcript_25032/g.62576 Transcript_25032/m.62576 type:complete len:277 (-) Transcript_25032:1510-2340(-)